MKKKTEKAESTIAPEMTDEELFAAGRRILSASDAEILPPLLPGEFWSGVYLGFVDRETEYGPAKLHLFEKDGGIAGRWGTVDLNDKMALCRKGYRTVMQGLTPKKIPGRKDMHRLAVVQAGDFDENAPVIDAERDAQSVYEALGIDWEKFRGVKNGVPIFADLAEENER